VPLLRKGLPTPFLKTILVTDPLAEYDRRLVACRARIAALERTHLLVSNGRLAAAGAGAVLLWLAFVRAAASPAWVLPPGLFFAALVVFHARLLNRMERARRAEQTYIRGIERLRDRWAGTGRDGTRFLDGHPYARDLDLFGPASLFELLNTTRTEAGEATLAEWLRAGAPMDEVRARQVAVDELRPMLDFREDVAVLAAESHVGRTGPLAAWSAAHPDAFPAALAPWFAFCALVTGLLAALSYAGFVASGWVIAWVVLQTGVAAIWNRRLHHVLHAIETPDHDLLLLADLLGRLEREPFGTPRLAALRDALMTDGMVPSRRIASLRSLVAWADSAHNLMFAPFAFAFLVRPQVALAISRWHRRHGPAVADWLRVVGEVEALSALATCAYEHPLDPFPELLAAGPLFEADGLGHPLMPGAASVRNDVRLGGVHPEGPRVFVISGSNMSGKSTLLRAVGVNVVLALAGAPVRALRLRLSPLVLGATLRIEDSLHEGHSRFYAEILRIRTIVETARGPVSLLFLLDEILHGTNSYDRRIGAEGIVRALVKLGAIGLVSTHDLALTELPATLGGVAVNMHFEDRLEDGRMVFDYRIRPGVVEHSNALALMRAIGLDV
jgi:MutS domain V